MRVILYAVPIMGSVEWWKMQGKVTNFVILMIAKSLLNQLWDTRNIFRPCLITWLPICSDTGFYLFSILSSLWKQLCFSLLVFSTGDISHGGTSGSQQQEFHTNDVNQCLHNKSDSHGVPNANLFNFTFFLVNFVKVLRVCEQAPAKLKCFF